MTNEITETEEIKVEENTESDNEIEKIASGVSLDNYADNEEELETTDSSSNNSESVNNIDNQVNNSIEIIKNNEESPNIGITEPIIENVINRNQSIEELEKGLEKELEIIEEAKIEGV